MMTQRGPFTTPVTHEPTAAERSRAARVTAAYANDAAELVEFLDMLGVAASEAREPGSAPDQVDKRERAEARARRSRTLMVSELAEMFADSGAARR